MNKFILKLWFSEMMWRGETAAITQNRNLLFFYDNNDILLVKNKLYNDF